MKASLAMPLALMCLLLASCQSAYYGTMEKFGVHKRDILIDRVDDAREAQEEAKEQFQSAFDAFLAVSEVDVSHLKRVYDRLNADFIKSEERAKAVHTKVEDIEKVSVALFKEWEAELAQYSSAELRGISGRQLEDTRLQCDSLLRSMREAASRMDPVLSAFRDQVLFLKHNLNAQAVSSLRQTSIGLKEEVAVLIRQMEASIAEANEFVAQMRNRES